MILMLLGRVVGIFFLLGVQVLGRLGVQQIHTLNLTQKHAFDSSPAIKIFPLWVVFCVPSTRLPTSWS